MTGSRERGTVRSDLPQRGQGVGVERVPLAVIIATKNRSDAIERYAFASLERSVFRDFVCVVWDASDDERTRAVAESAGWSFPLRYFKAPRAGLTSQRNDAAGYVLKHIPSVRYVLFIDDDSELSCEALEGVLRSFEDDLVWGVNVPQAPLLEKREGARKGVGRGRLSRAALRSRVVTSYLHNKGACPEAHGIGAQWLSGCGMAFRREVFEELGLCFPEAFQRFGGYALGEDVALSFYLHKKKGKRLVNAVSGTLRHHASGGARLNVANMAASKWYNFHLLFECLYDDVRGPGLLWLKVKFKLFMLAAALKLLIRARSVDAASLFRGIGFARAALREFHAERRIETLFFRVQQKQDKNKIKR